jgi:hypothetical protein
MQHKSKNTDERIHELEESLSKLNDQRFELQPKYIQQTRNYNFHLDILTQVQPINL